MREFDISFGEYLKLLRERKGIKYTDLYTSLGVSDTYLSKIERGAKPPTRDRQIQIVEFLSLNDSERDKFYDLASNERKELPADIVDYLINNPRAIKDLREQIRK